MNGFVDDDGPEERVYDVTITISNGELVGTVAEAAVEDVVQVHVGDTVAFTFANETDEAVGVHDHASDTEFVIDADGEQIMEFEMTEAMIGRQEIEAWFAVDAASQEDDAHVEDATTIVIVEVRPRGS